MVARQRTIFASDLNKPLEHQLNARSSINIKFISFAKERRKKTVTGNLFVLRFRPHSEVRHVGRSLPITHSYNARKLRHQVDWKKLIDSESRKAKYLQD
jgi:hypothetical protein